MATRGREPPRNDEPPATAYDLAFAGDGVMEMAVALRPLDVRLEGPSRV